MLCSKLHCQQNFDLILFSNKMWARGIVDFKVRASSTECILWRARLYSGRASEWTERLPEACGREKPGLGTQESTNELSQIHESCDSHC